MALWDEDAWDANLSPKNGNLENDKDTKPKSGQDTTLLEPLSPIYDLYYEFPGSNVLKHRPRATNAAGLPPSPTGILTNAGKTRGGLANFLAPTAQQSPRAPAQLSNSPIERSFFGDSYGYMPSRSGSPRLRDDNDADGDDRTNGNSYSDAYINIYLASSQSLRNKDIKDALRRKKDRQKIEREEKKNFYDDMNAVFSDFQPLMHPTMPDSFNMGDASLSSKLGGQPKTAVAKENENSKKVDAMKSNDKKKKSGGSILKTKQPVNHDNYLADLGFSEEDESDTSLVLNMGSYRVPTPTEKPKVGSPNNKRSLSPSGKRSEGGVKPSSKNTVTANSKRENDKRLQSQSSLYSNKDSNQTLYSFDFYSNRPTSVIPLSDFKAVTDSSPKINSKSRQSPKARARDNIDEESNNFSCFSPEVSVTNQSSSSRECSSKKLSPRAPAGAKGPISPKNRMGTLAPSPPASSSEKRSRPIKSAEKRESSSTDTGLLESNSLTGEKETMSSSTDKRGDSKSVQKIAKIETVLLTGSEGAKTVGADKPGTRSVLAKCKDFSEVIGKSNNLADDQLRSTIFSNAAREMVEGYNVNVMTVHSDRRQPTRLSLSWNRSILPSFFHSLFFELGKLPNSQNIQVTLSMVLVKQDMWKDLVAPASPFVTLMVSGFPLLGVQFDGAKYVPILSAHAACSLVMKASSTVNADDYAKGAILYSVNLKRIICNSANGQREDVRLSSLFYVSCGLDLLCSVIKSDTLPKTSTLLRYSIRSPMQLIFCVDGKEMDSEEETTALELKRLFTTLTPRPLKPGSLKELMRQVKRKTKQFYTELAQQKQKYETSRDEWRARTYKKDKSNPSKDVIRAEIQTQHDLYQTYRLEKLKFKRLKFRIRSLERILRDCEHVFNSEATVFPPSYLVTSLYLTPNWFTDPQEASKFVFGAFAGENVDGKSEISYDSVLNGRRKKKYFFPYRKTAPVLNIFDNWKPKIPKLNLFAGDNACASGGVFPAFRSNEYLFKKHFVTITTNEKVNKIFNVIFLEDPEKDPLTGTVPKAEVFASGQHTIKVKLKKTTDSEFKEYQVDEIVQRKGGENYKIKSSQRQFSTLLRDTLASFRSGGNVHVHNMVGGGPQTCSMARLLRSPVWLALRDMVEDIFQGNYGSSSGSFAGSKNGELSFQPELYLSIVQILSAAFVRDYFHSKKANTNNGQNVTSPNKGDPANDEDDAALPFRAAWTPCGPVVEGACYVRITNVAMFWKLLLDLPTCVSENHTDQTHLMLSFILKQSVSTEYGSFSGGGLNNASILTEGTMLSSLSVKMTTDVALFNSLYVKDFVSPSHPQNLFNFNYCDRVVSVVDILADEVNEATFFLNGQSKLMEDVSVPFVHSVWNMHSYVSYLREYIACMKSLLDSTTTARKSKLNSISKDKNNRGGSADAAKMPSAEALKSVLVTGGIPDERLADAWRQAERMCSIAAELLNTRSTWAAEIDSSPKALSIDTEQVYHLMAPPHCFTKYVEEEEGDSQNSSVSNVCLGTFFGSGSERTQSELGSGKGSATGRASRAESAKMFNKKENKDTMLPYLTSARSASLDTNALKKNNSAQKEITSLPTHLRKNSV